MLVQIAAYACANCAPLSRGCSCSTTAANTERFRELGIAMTASGAQNSISTLGITEDVRTNFALR